MGEARVNFLAAALPGLRDFRSPFSAGVLWLTTISLLALPHLGSILSSARGRELAATIDGMPSSLLIAAYAFAAYILGIVGTAMATRTKVLIGERIRKKFDAQERIGRISRWLRRLAALFERTSEKADQLLAEAILQRFESRGAPKVLALGFPVALAREDSELSALRLSKESPEQFQQYDKTLAEAEFRAAVSTPVLALSLAAATYTGWYAILLVLFGIAVFIALEYRAALDFRRSDELLATTIFLEYTSPPSIDKTLRQYDNDDVYDRYSSDVHSQIIWFLAYMHSEGKFDYLDYLRSLVRHPSHSEAFADAFTAWNMDGRGEMLADALVSDGWELVRSESSERGSSLRLPPE